MPIFNLLSKYDGKTFHDDPKFRKLYKIKKLPKYLIFHYKRFIQNKFFIEKNSTIVSFPLNNLDLS
jgi:U4/U6.U5 tri-snRNP-associated protein 2